MAYEPLFCCTVTSIGPNVSLAQPLGCRLNVLPEKEDGCMGSPFSLACRASLRPICHKDSRSCLSTKRREKKGGGSLAHDLLASTFLLPAFFRGERSLENGASDGGKTWKWEGKIGIVQQYLSDGAKILQTSPLKSHPASFGI